ncbi:MAG: MMPL family transporter [Myxococcota bacterium]
MSDDGLRARRFAALAELGLHRPGMLLAMVGVLTLVAGLVIPGLGVSTSRTGMMSEDDPQQALLVDFYERFGRPESAVFLVQGGDAAQRREVVDQLQASLNAEADVQGRVFAHVDAGILAPLLLLQRPDTLLQVRAQLPPDADLNALLAGGLPAWFRALETQIYVQLDGAEESEESEDPGSPTGADPPAGDGAPAGEATPAGEGTPAGKATPATAATDPAAQADEGLRQLAGVARLLEAVLVGEDPWGAAGAEQQLAGQPGLDERGYLTTAAGDGHLVTVYPELPSDEGVEVAPVVRRLRAIRDEVMAAAPEGITAELTGVPALSTDELTVLESGLQTSALSTTTGIALLCLLLFRSFRQMVVALIPLAPGVVGTLAVVRLLYDDLNLITSSFVAVLLGLGIDFSVHAIARYNEELRAGLSPADAVRAAMVRTGPSVLTGAVVTAAAFLTSATTEFTAFGELGIITSIGLLIVVAATFALLPALLRRKPGVARVAPEPPGLGALPSVIRRVAWPLLLLGVAGAVAGAVALPRVEFNPRYFDFLPETAESTRALDDLEYDPLASPVFANLRAESIEQARQMTERLRALPSVAGVQTPSDLLPPLTDEGLAALRAGFEGLPALDFDALAARATTPEQLAAAVGGVVDALDESLLAMTQAGLPTAAMDEAIAAFRSLRDRARDLDDAGRERLAGLESQAAALLRSAWTTARAVAERGYYEPGDLPELFARRYASRDGRSVALFVVPAGRFWERDVAERFRLDMVEIDPKVSGLATVHVRHGEIVVEGFRRAALLAAGLVLLILAVDFRSLKDAVLALVPTVVGWLWMAGLMVLVGLRFDVANVVSMPLVLGIGIAFGVHMMHRCREVEARDEPVEGRLDTVVRGTGGAIAVAALTTMVGFGGLTVSAHGGMTSFGRLMMVGIGTCLLATVLVLPALLLVIRRVR